MFKTYKDRQKQNQELLEAIKAKMPALEKWLEHISWFSAEEDYIYRFYHQSFKVQWLQVHTKSAVQIFTEIQPDLNEWFLEIVKQGTPGEFEMKWNDDWLKYTLPITTAYFHTKYFIEQMVKYGKEYETAPNLLDSGWAAVLYLFNQR